MYNQAGVGTIVVMDSGVSHWDGNCLTTCVGDIDKQIRSSNSSGLHQRNEGTWR